MVRTSRHVTQVEKFILQSRVEQSGTEKGLKRLGEALLCLNVFYQGYVGST